MQSTTPGSPTSETTDERYADLRALWRALQETTIDAVLLFNDRGLIEDCNLNAERLFGYTSQELIGNRIDAVLPATWLHHDTLPQTQSTETATRVRHEDLLGQKKDGSTFPVRLAVGDFTDGRRRRFIGIAHDISLLKSAEAKLLEREKLLSLTIQHAPTGIATVDLQGRFLSLNRAFCAILVYSEDELLHRPVNSITHPDDVESADRRLKQLQQGQLTEYRTRKRYIRKDGSVVEGLLSACLIHNSDGEPLMYVGQVEDLTRQLRAETEAKENQDRLARVSRLNLLGEMAAGIAHEVNQPLTAIATYAHATRRILHTETVDAARVSDILRKIAAQAERAGDVIRRLREFVRERSSAREVVGVDSLLREIVQLAEVDARMHDLTITIAVEPQLAPVFADPVQIQQVTLNLIRNAIDAMQSSDLSVRTIEVQGRWCDPDFVAISVVDHGTGISEEAEKRLFRAFYTTKESGLGMGLAISRSIVDSHGGRLWFTRNQAGGTTFHFTLPAAEGQSGVSA